MREDSCIDASDVSVGTTLNRRSTCNTNQTILSSFVKVQDGGAHEIRESHFTSLYESSFIYRMYISLYSRVRAAPSSDPKRYTLTTRGR